MLRRPLRATTTAAVNGAVPLLLAMLLRRRRVLLPSKEVLLSTSHPLQVVGVLEQARYRATRAARTTERDSQRQPLAPPRRARATDLLTGLPGLDGTIGPAASSAAVRYVVVSAGPSSSLPLPSSAHTVCLPLSLLDVAQFHRAQHRERLPLCSAATSSRSGTSPPAALLETTSRDATVPRSVGLYCGAASKELVVVSVPASAEVDDYVWEALLVAESVLEEDGTLLLVSPHAFSRRVRHFLKWRFHDVQCAVCETSAAHYAVCDSLTAAFDHPVVRRDDFPGHFLAGERRPRRWSPYRRAQSTKFVTSLRPAFTNAPFTKDALRRKVEQERDAAEHLRDADDAFFAVAREMVEEGAHHSRPEN
ncbi:hypothetical protein NESM_000815200 [Novymonas esmeraldas]|uniref:Uncharacterized protein n=1 Tax=Novymonas esmeraldas TaxID=1808958 RepID=A0AAW0EW50_9TRYP